MSDFAIAINVVLKNEGGYEDDKNDDGGATNFGLSLRFLKTLYPNWTVENVKNLDLSTAIQLYKTEFWNKSGYQGISNQRIATYALDCAVNHGIEQANKFLQRAIMAVDTYPSLVKDDGVMGSVTLARVNSAEIDSLALWCAMKAIRADFFRALVRETPSDAEFLSDWLRRAYERL